MTWAAPEDPWALKKRYPIKASTKHRKRKPRKPGAKRAPARARVVVPMNLKRKVL